MAMTSGTDHRTEHKYSQGWNTQYIYDVTGVANGSRTQTSARFLDGVLRASRWTAMRVSTREIRHVTIQVDPDDRTAMCEENCQETIA